MKVHEHLLINSVVGVGLLKTGVFDQNEVLAFVSANVLDVDHISLMIELKSLDVRKVICECLYRVKIAQPGFYIFHTFEITVFMLIIGLLYDGIIRAFVFGWCLHMILDGARNIVKHKSDFHWIRYWCIFNWKMLWKEQYPKK